MSTVHDQRYIEVAALMRKARKRAGITQRQVAQRLGRPQSYVSKVETCERRADYVELLEMCRAVGTQLGEVTPKEFHDLLRLPADE